MVDAVDTVTAKIELVMKAQECGVPIISSMGAGNNMRPACFRWRIFIRRGVPVGEGDARELKKRGVKKLKVVYSEEKPMEPVEDMAVSCRSNCICPPGAEHKCTVSAGRFRAVWHSCHQWLA